MEASPCTTYGHGLVKAMSDVEDFDDAERERIRRRLDNYAKNRGLGMPTLAKRISDATPNNPKINHRTLARFIGEKHTTNRLLVKWCQDFLKEAAPDPLKDMAEGLKGFYGSGASFWLDGTYFIWSHTDDLPTRTGTADIRADDGFFRVPLESTVDHAIYDGILLSTGPMSSLMLKNRLTGQPCLALVSLRGSVFSGTMIETTIEGTKRVVNISIMSSDSDAVPVPVRGVVVEIVGIDTSDVSPVPVGTIDADFEEISAMPFTTAYGGDVEKMMRWITRNLEVSIDVIDETTGLTALHIAIGRNHLDLTRFLLEKGARIVPDRNGRWPTLIAAECNASDELYDLVADAEIAAEGKDGESV